MVEIYKYKDLVLMISIACAMFTLWIDVPGLQLMFLLPLCYGFCFRLFVPNGVGANSGLLILFLVLSFRYLLYPVLLYLDYTPIPNVAYWGNQAVLFMLIEMLFIFATIAWTFRGKDITFTLLENRSVNHSVLVVLTILSIGFLLAGNKMYATSHFIWETDAIVEEVENNNSGVASMVFSWFSAFFMIYFMSRFSEKFAESRRNIYFVVSVVICFMPCIMYSGSSRLSLLIPLVGSCVLLYKLYGKKSRLAIFICLVGGAIVLTLLSLVKFFHNGNAGEGTGDLFSASLFNAYFEGIGNVIVGLRAYEHYGVNPSWFIWDSLRNAMGISENFVNFPGTNIAFNNELYGASGIAYDQIVPTMASGMMYFGQFFFFIPTVIMTYIVCKCDIIFAHTKSLEKAYLYSNFPIIVAWAVPGSWMHLTARFFNFYLPILFLIYINSKIGKK